eukprot:TRINITY_DN22837_c1_g1_i3.p2 TRINITY_DN22837_c1_g1~~TRINITY_DN22837_c1_g1_i3.p2  ORF type:complete len:138 (-),score=18.28 TRINITY_DN22837_c1_g1_i3:298-711(-)
MDRTQKSKKGDAVLDYMVMRKNFRDNPASPPGELSALKMKYVNNVYLGFRCVKLQLHQHICHKSAPMSEDVAKFERQLKSSDIDMLNIDEKDVGIEAPKVLGDVVESLIGAVYVDTKGDFGIISRVVQCLLYQQDYD